MRILIALTSLTLISPAFTTQASDWYGGGSFGKADFSDLTISDREASSLSIYKQDEKPNYLELTAGKELTENFSLELSYLDLGKVKLGGQSGSATIDSVEKTKGILASLLLKPSANQQIRPFLRFGIFAGRKSATSDKTNATGVFANPHDEKASGNGMSLAYGFGVDYDISKKWFARFEWSVLHDAQNDYINNIDNGYIQRDVDLIGLGVFRKFGEKKTSTETNGISASVFYGISKTNARMTGGEYSGNTWNLTTNTISSTVSGSMTDDKKDSYIRLAIAKELDNKNSIELFLSDFGTFKSRSSNLGITGGGNALTGASQRESQALGVALAHTLVASEKKFSIEPSIGVALVRTRDEIYNNLDFAGVGGSARGPIHKSNDLTWTVGMAANYVLSNNLDISIRYDYFDDAGNNDALGSGNLQGYGAGLRYKF